ncbi:MAG: conjugal transfer protein TraX [Defluviitaleaceae bacterium]|nr:conjugal transfer protein TraX [Defluviitaleaceae bacterium]
MQKSGFNAYTLKMIAIIGMAMQHTAIVLGDVIPTILHFPLQFGGGFTFPIMAFFVVQGYNHTSNLPKYMGRIFIFALIAQLPYMLAFSSAFFVAPIHFSIMFTILIGLLLLVMYDKMKSHKLLWLFWILFVPISLVTFIFDWGIVGPLMIILYHIIKNHTAKSIVVPIVAAGGTFAVGIIAAIIALIGVAIMMASGGTDALADMADNLLKSFDPNALKELAETQGPLLALTSLMFPLGSLCVIPLLLKYNGERGRSMKYLFYAFYPLHLLILALIALALGIGGTLNFDGLPGIL